MAQFAESGGSISIRDSLDFPRFILGPDGSITTRDSTGENARAVAIGDSIPLGVAPVTGSPEVEIQAALDTAAANVVAGTGPTTVKVAPGVYTVDIHLLPSQSGGDQRAAAIWVGDGVGLDLTGVTLKLKAGVTLPASANCGHIITTTQPTLRPAAGGTIKNRICVYGGILDGNGGAQTYGAGSSVDGTHPLIHSLMFLGFCENAKVINTKGQALWGNAGGPPGESFHFDVWSSVNVEFIGCEADGSALSNTATGFSASNSQTVTWTACDSHDMGHGHGFTHYQCGGVIHDGCNSYKNGAGSGFNTELSEGVSYGACISGGKSFTRSDASAVFWKYADGTSLANDKGWTVQGSSRVTWDAACQGNYNTSAGVHVYSNASVSPTVPSQTVRIAGTFIGTVAGRDSTILVESAADGGSAKDQVNVSWNISVREDESNNVGTIGGISPTQELWVKVGNGFRYFMRKTFTAAPTSYSIRWLRDNDSSNFDLALSDIGQVVTRGRRVNRNAQAGDYTIIATDEYVGCTGTATVAQAITLPAAANVGAGAVYTVKDEAGGAATHNITITKASTDTIDGATSIVIDVNYGEVELVCTGSGWSVISKRIVYDPALDPSIDVGTVAPDWPDSTVSLTASRVYLMRFVTRRDMSIIKIAFSVGTASGSNDSCDVGILNSAGTLLVSAGATAGQLNSTGVKAITVAATALKAGTVYYAAFAYGTPGGTVAQLASKLFGASTGGALFEATPGTLDSTCRNLAKDTAYPIVTTTPASCFLTSNVPVLALRES